MKKGVKYLGKCKKSINLRRDTKSRYYEKTPPLFNEFVYTLFVTHVGDSVGCRRYSFEFVV